MAKFNSASPAWNDIPALKVSGSISLTAANQVTAYTSEGPLTISLHPFGARLRFGDCQFGEYGMLVEEPTGESLTLDSQDAHTVIKGAGHTLKLCHEPLSFELFKGERCIQKSPTDGHFVRRFRLPPVARVEEGWFVSLELDSSEPVYGLGEKWGRLDKRGQLVRSYNHDALGVNAEISYKNTPFAWSPNGWGAFVHTPAPVTHGVGFAAWSQRAYGLLVEDTSMDLMLLSADNGAAMLESYTALTGRAPVPPTWSLGVILSKAYYKDVDELLATARAVREHKMPCDVITLDGRAWQDTDTRFAFEWDPKRYPDPAAVMNELKAMNFKVCVWEYPLVSVENPLFDKMAEKGWLLKDRRTGDTYRYQWDMSCFGEVLTPLPESGIVDFTHPEAYAFWRDSHKPLFDLGVDMIKADFGEQVEENMLAHNGDSGETLHNAYTLLYNRCVYEAAERYCKSGPFLFSRSSWTGSQRYPAQWGGDPQADWGGLAGSLRGGLSWGMSGAPFYATDVGGFYGDQRDSELYVRWSQAAVFSAHMRLHGIGQREPWSYGEEAGQAVNKALKLRYELFPYMSDVMEQASNTGLPVQRAMVLTCPDEKAAWAFEDQFFFGDDMLVAPCVAPGGEVEVYLPCSVSESWCRFPSGEKFEGGKSHKLKMPLDEIAVFVPEGRTIPMGPAVEYSDVLTQQGGLPVINEWQAK
ncbi:alpha-xylosidase [Pseudomaricurvus alkylphenolicus]|uniref:glycoside hydrolase family 31 protein n=1 Tax=Pseudomaricurvus alkylphenolicus TaxID=1306991 RepID=UPI0014244E1F|nr:alpha-xylosidase [Pseudomaricurvus alkylphenolicus]NIB40464.1 alpha-xylosidase [Pseudomaricurvus alkylphenolicus]